MTDAGHAENRRGAGPPLAVVEPSGGETDDGFVLVLVCDGEGRVRIASPIPEANWGTVVGEALGDSAMPDGIRATLEDLRLQVERSGRPSSSTLAAAVGRSPSLVEVVATPVKGLDGRPGAVAFTLRDLEGSLRAEKVLRDVEDRYRLLADNSTDLISRHDPEGVYRYASPACRALLGYEPEEMVGRLAYDLIHPDDHHLVERSHARVMESAATQTVTYRIRHQDGDYLWFETTARTLRDRETGRIVEIQCASRDVSARVRTEEALRESEGRLQAVLDSSKAVIYVKDLQGRYCLINRRFESLFRISKREVVGKTDLDIFPAEVADAFRANDLKVARGRSPLELEECAPHDDGEHTYLSIKVPLVGADGEPYAVCGISTDISERKRAEAALHESEERFRGAFDAAAVGMVVASPDGRFLEVNESFCRIVGYDEAELLSLDFHAITHPDDLDADLGNALALMDGRIPSYRMEKRYIHKHGHVVWVVLSVSPVRDAGGRPASFVGLIEDITPRKQAEERLQAQNLLLQTMAESERRAHAALKQAQVQLIQSEKLSALGQMVAGVAHEINNPLAFVTNNVAVLRRDVDNLNDLLGLYREADTALAEHAPGLLAPIRELAERIDLPYTIENLDQLSTRSLEGLRRIRQIVRDLRDFARLDEGDLKEADLNDGIASTLNVVRNRAKERGVELRSDLQPLPTLACYPGKINQVVLNLVVNALDACPAGGHVALTTRAVADRVEIEVVDDGSGIAPEVRDKIFDPFFTTKPVGEGTGLGLSISYGIVQAHGGRIEVESTPGRGSRFLVALPLSPAPEPRPTDGAPPAPR